jgi:hypothetical protein
MKKAIVVAFVLSLALSANAGILKGSYKSAKYVGKHAKPAVVKSAKFIKKVVY